MLAREDGRWGQLRRVGAERGSWEAWEAWGRSHRAEATSQESDSSEAVQKRPRELRARGDTVCFLPLPPENQSPRPHQLLAPWQPWPGPLLPLATGQSCRTAGGLPLPLPHPVHQGLQAFRKWGPLGPSPNLQGLH